MILKRLSVWVVLALAMALGGCGDSDSDESSSSGASGGSGSIGGVEVSGIEREARDAAVAEIQKHWSKNADGWTTAKTSGSPYAPDRYLQQFRELAVSGVESYNLSESDKLNGFEWAGEVAFKKSPAREAGDSGIAFDGMAGMNVDRAVGRWSQWVDYTPDSLRVQKVKGQWQVQSDSSMLNGELPTPEDFAKAGVK